MRVHLPLLIAVLLALAVMAAAGRASAAESPKDDDQAQALFRSAFEEHLTPEKRVKVLERVVKDHADSAWADDALWVLGEAARRQGLPLRVVYYWQFLVARWPNVHLEDYTRSLGFYRVSPFGGTERLLQMEGTLYSRQAGRIVPGKAGAAFAYSNAVAYNAIPMLVWEELGDCYAELGAPDLAVAAYGKALAALPPGGQVAATTRKRVGGKLTAQQAKVPAKATAAGPDGKQAATPQPAHHDAARRPEATAAAAEHPARPRTASAAPAETGASD